jgi:hypothetical protein
MPLSFVVMVFASMMAVLAWEWAAIPLIIVTWIAYYNALQELHPSSPLYVRDLVEASASGRLVSGTPISLREAA